VSGYDMFEPPLCTCGHYAYVHSGRRGRCPGWTRKQPLRLFNLTILLRCRCRRFVRHVESRRDA